MTTNATTETTTTTRTGRENARCKRCGRAESRLVTTTYVTTRSTATAKVLTRRETRSLPHASMECCSRSWGFLPVKGVRRPEVVCNAKCTGSTGHVCECSCGGRNHGASFSAEVAA